MATTYDGEVFTAIFDAHRQVAFALLVGRTSDREAARDLLQETFLRVWRRLDEVNAMDANRQRGWILTVARNLTIDHYRARATSEGTRAALEQEASQPAVVAEPTERLEWRERLDRVHEAIGRLPEEQRIVLGMATLAEMGSAEIGAALDQPAGTVRYKLHQARKQLAGELNVEE